MKPTHKTLKITEETHSLLRKYCQIHSLKINDWVDKLIKSNIDTHAKKTNNKRIHTKI